MNTEEMLAIMDAYSRGEDVESKRIGSSKWVATPKPKWDWSKYLYRVEPNVHEYYLIKDGDNTLRTINLFNTEKEAQDYLSAFHKRLANDYTIVHVKEVL